MGPFEGFGAFGIGGSFFGGYRMSFGKGSKTRLIGLHALEIFDGVGKQIMYSSNSFSKTDHESQLCWKYRCYVRFAILPRRIRCILLLWAMFVMIVLSLRRSASLPRYVAKYLAVYELRISCVGYSTACSVGFYTIRQGFFSFSSILIENLMNFSLLLRTLEAMNHSVNCLASCPVICLPHLLHQPVIQPQPSFNVCASCK